jgi:hypothetical protein
VDNYWPTADKRERIGHPIGDRRMRVDVISVYDIDVVFQDDPIKLGRHRAQEVAVWHPAISAQFRNVVDLDPFTCVILRIRGHAAVRYLMLLDPGEHGERCIVPERLLRVP